MNEKQLNVNAGSAVKVEDNNDMEITTDKVIKKNLCLAPGHMHLLKTS